MNISSIRLTLHSFTNNKSLNSLTLPSDLTIFKPGGYPPSLLTLTSFNKNKLEDIPLNEPKIVELIDPPVINRVYPNPNRGNLNIDVNLSKGVVSAIIKVTDLTGRTVKSIAVYSNGVKEIDLSDLENGNYFSDKNIKYFKRIGSIFISYTVSVLILRFLLTAIDGSSFKFFNELKGEFTFLIPAGLAFYILAEIFEKGKQVEEENDLTI